MSDTVWFACESHMIIHRIKQVTLQLHAYEIDAVHALQVTDAWKREWTKKDKADYFVSRTRQPPPYKESYV